MNVRIGDMNQLKCGMVWYTKIKKDYERGRSQNKNKIKLISKTNICKN